MFRPAGLFKSHQCPDQHCIRSPCPLSHGPTQTPKTETSAHLNRVSNDVPTLPRKPTSLSDPQAVARGPDAPTLARTSNNVDIPGPSSSEHRLVASTSRTIPPAASRPSVVAPRPSRLTAAPRVEAVKRPVETPSLASSPPPPAKLPKVAPGPVRKPTPSATSLSATGAPILNINAANTNVPLKERQKMVTVIYETFRTLYGDIPSNPQTTTLPGQHAIAQETEIYNRSQRGTYKNNVAHTIAAIKKRPRPNSLSHPSIGTQGTIDARKAEAELAKQSMLEREQIEYARLSRQQLSQWGYLVEVPDTPGGTRVSDEGLEATCERCQTLFVVHGPQNEDEERELALKCTYHWGRTYLNRAGGLRETLYRCCGAPGGSPGCVVGAHVFKDPEDFNLLHARHPYSLTSAFQSPGASTLSELDIAALDCEMIYTTAGMSLARVTVIDGSGKSVYDKLVKLDAGVAVLDYNTRFSGVKSLSEAKVDLDGVRRELRVLIGPETILIGHALENDMRALRMVHLNVVDTTVLFPHASGFPYRRALRDLARIHLGLLIQNATEGAETQGHSSLEDAVATLDLVKFWVQEQRRKSGRRVA